MYIYHQLVKICEFLTKHPVVGFRLLFYYLAWCPGLYSSIVHSFKGYQQSIIAAHNSQTPLNHTQLFCKGSVQIV